MNESSALPMPLQLTEKARTCAGLMRVVLSTYASGALSVDLVPEPRAPDNEASLLISADQPGAEGLARGEFAAACPDAALAQSLLQCGLFRATGHHLAQHPVWSLDGLARIEFLSAFRPPLAASRASFPSHLFHDKDFDLDAQKRLIQTFEADSHTRHSARGAAVWVVRQYCERHKLPFTVYLLQEQDATVGAMVCKRAAADALADQERRQGRSVQMVYESPACS